LRRETRKAAREAKVRTAPHNVEAIENVSAAETIPAADYWRATLAQRSQAREPLGRCRRHNPARRGKQRER
jgi:hypothetical protein